MQILQLWAVLLGLSGLLGLILFRIVAQLRSSASPHGWPVPSLAPNLHRPAAKPNASGPEAASVERRRKIRPAGELAASEVLACADGLGGYYAALGQRLEQAFDLYTRERISIDTYASMIRGEMQAIDRYRIEQRGGDLHRFGADRFCADQMSAEDAALAEDALVWCLAWAEQRGAEQRGAEQRGAARPEDSGCVPVLD